MSLSCFIFDDEISSISEVSFLIGKFAPSWKVTGTASTVQECRSLMQTQHADIIFVDIQFGELNIFDELPELKNFKGDVIFISEDNGYATQAFQFNAKGYLLKPLIENHFIQILNKFQISNIDKTFNTPIEVLYHHIPEKQIVYNKIAFNTTKGYVIKDVSDIVYAKANSNYTEFLFLDSDKVEVTKTMLEYEKMLNGMGFLRIHQSYLVNFKFVDKFDKDNLQLSVSNGDCLPVSNRRKPILMEILKGVF
jgi:two-component system LytT family response regulator